MVKEEKPKVKDGTRAKGRRLKQSNSTQKASFKAPTTGLEDKVFNFGKQKHASDFMNNREEIAK